jgi:hypothetical protein
MHRVCSNMRDSVRVYTLVESVFHFAQIVSHWRAIALGATRMHARPLTVRWHVRPVNRARCGIVARLRANRRASLTALSRSDCAPRSADPPSFPNSALASLIENSLKTHLALIHVAIYVQALTLSVNPCASLCKQGASPAKSRVDTRERECGGASLPSSPHPPSLLST